jgi:hypothetical protein
MQQRQRPIAPHLVEQIKRTVHEAMEPFGLRSVEVLAGEDHDGDPVIFVEAQYDLSERPLELGVTSELSSVVNDLVWNSGETRFAHVWHKFHEKQTVAKPARRARG